MKKAFIAIPSLALVVLILTAGACDGSQTAAESDQVSDQQSVYATSQPVPQYDYSPERDELIQIYNARMKVVNTWTVIYSMGKPVFVCPSKGYPIPYTTQLTNPNEVTSTETYKASQVLPQAEPNGLYTGQSMATWVLCIRSLPGGGSEVEPVYSEPDALAFPYPVTIGSDGSVQDAGGSSSVQINVKSKG